MADMPDSGSSFSPTRGEIYEQIRAQIEHEDNLVTQRLNWFLTSQSFLLTAYAVVFTGTPSVNSHDVGMRMTLLAIIPTIAVAAGALILAAIVAGAIVMRNLRLEFTPYRQQAQSAGLPPLQGIAATRILGLLAPVGLPIIFISVWMIVIWRMKH
jgi:hypothetical protein